MKLPPLSALRAFDAAVRMRNFTRAAEELNITHGAVSRHVATLEELLGLTLFERGGRGVAPTRAGVLLYQALRDGADKIYSVVSALRAEERGAPIPVRVSVVHSFALYWLIPRLPDLYACHPDIEVMLVAEPGLVDSIPLNVDFSIRYGLGGWDGVSAQRVTIERRWPVASPRIAQAGLMEALSKVGILHDVHPENWSLYLAEAGLEAPGGMQERLLNDYTLCLECAVAGLGVALARSSAIQRDLESGRLVSLGDQRIGSPRGYFLVRPSASTLSPAAELVWKWVGETAAAGYDSSVTPGPRSERAA